MPMTSAERVRKMRERRRVIEGKNLIIKIKKTRTEIERDSRERRKLRDQLLKSSYTNDQILINPSSLNCFQYPYYNKFKTAHNIFIREFVANEFGSSCFICDRIWFKSDLKPLSIKNEEHLQTKFPEFKCFNELACISCHQSIRKGNIPTLSKLNGFTYPPIPPELPKLDIISERFISPCVPFMQIRSFNCVHNESGLLSQVINIPVECNTLVKELPRNDDYCTNVNIMMKKITKESSVNKKDIEIWLRFLKSSPLYQMYNIKINESFFNKNTTNNESENAQIDENYVQQHTLLLNIDKYLNISPHENNLPHSILFNQYVEEMSFPTIYLGQFRNFCKELFRVTSYMMAASELRRSDRRGVTPDHLLYMAMKLMYHKIRDSINLAIKNKDIHQTEECIENLNFLRFIPNSALYWAEKKEELFAMIRQLGRPTLFLTMSANEINWTSLLRILYKLKHKIEISEETIQQLSFIEKSTLIRDDSVTCAIYFNKMLNVIMNILQSKKSSPFGKFRVDHYFKRIEFDSGIPRAHILLWLDNAPVNNKKIIELIERITSVSALEASENIQLQHKCYKKSDCEAPFMPCKYTTILTPMKKDDPGFFDYKQHYNTIKKDLEINDYPDMNSFYTENQIISDEYYIKVLQAGINRPKVFIKRQPIEKWYHQFNPFIFNVLKSSMDIQFILDEYSCAAYIYKYINKNDRGVSSLRNSMNQIMKEHPEFDIIDIAKKISIDVLNAVEITSQEAAWYLLREPLSKSSTSIVYIPTIKPAERKSKTQKGLDEIYTVDGGSIKKDNWFDKYEKRPDELKDINLAQFVSNYTLNGDSYTHRKERRIIRWRNYNMVDLNEYKREMVTLYIPFRNEEYEIITENKFIQIYDTNEMFILQQQKEFSAYLDICKKIELCTELCEENGFNDAEVYHRIEHSITHETIETNATYDSVNGLNTHVIIKEEPSDQNFEIGEETPDIDFETEENPICDLKEIIIKKEPIEDYNQTKESINDENNSELIENKSNKTDEKDCKIIDTLMSYISAEIKKNLQKLSPEKRTVFINSMSDMMNEFMNNV